VQKEGKYPAASHRARKSSIVPFIKDFRMYPHVVLLHHKDASLRVAFREAGAQHVLELPCDRRELQLVVGMSGGMRGGEITWGDITMNPDEMFWVHGKPIHFTKTESKILATLMRHPTRINSKEFIIDRLYVEADAPQNRIVDVYVCKVRRKLQSVLEYNPIQTVWSRGYMMTPQENCHVRQ
jgi:two-component system cell cycle response regulator CtrA